MVIMLAVSKVTAENPPQCILSWRDKGLVAGEPTTSQGEVGDARESFNFFPGNFLKELSKSARSFFSIRSFEGQSDGKRS